MDWLNDLIERIVNFFNKQPDNDYQQTRKNVGLKPITLAESIINLMIIIILAFITFVVIGLLGHFGFI